MATEIIRLENVNLVRVQLTGADGKLSYGDLEWPTVGNLVLAGGEGGIIASGEMLPNGLRPTVRFAGKGLSVSSVQVHYRPVDPATADPTKAAKMVLSSYTPDAAPADQSQQQSQAATGK